MPLDIRPCELEIFSEITYELCILKIVHSHHPSNHANLFRNCGKRSLSQTLFAAVMHVRLRSVHAVAGRLGSQLWLLIRQRLTRSLFTAVHMGFLARRT